MKLILFLIQESTLVKLVLFLIQESNTTGILSILETVQKVFNISITSEDFLGLDQLVKLKHFSKK